MTGYVRILPVIFDILLVINPLRTYKSRNHRYITGYIRILLVNVYYQLYIYLTGYIRTLPVTDT